MVAQIAYERRHVVLIIDFVIIRVLWDAANSEVMVVGNQQVSNLARIYRAAVSVSVTRRENARDPIVPRSNHSRFGVRAVDQSCSVRRNSGTPTARRDFRSTARTTFSNTAIGTPR